MLIKRMIFILLLGISSLLPQGCNSIEEPIKSETSLNIPTVSTKLGVVSSSFLEAEKEKAGQTSHGLTIAFAKNGVGFAYIEPFEGKYRVVHNGTSGELYRRISQLSISNDGKRVAYIARLSNHGPVLMVDGTPKHDFGNNDNFWFTPDSKHFISTFSERDVKYLAIDGKINKTVTIEQGVELSPDSSLLAFSTKSSGGNTKFIISDLLLKNMSTFENCGDSILASKDAALLAVRCSEGSGNSIKVIDFLKRSVVFENKFNGTVTQIDFSPYNRSLSFTYFVNEKEKHVVYSNNDEKIPAPDDFMTAPVVLSEPASVGVVIGDAYKVRFYRAFQKQNKNGKLYAYISDLVSSSDGRNHAYIATDINDEKMHIVVNGHEGPKFDKLVTPAFSPDGKTLVYRAREAGKRFMVISDLNGKIMQRHKAYDMLFQPVFSADGASVAYGVIDGNEIWWKVEKL